MTEFILDGIITENGPEYILSMTQALGCECERIKTQKAQGVYWLQRQCRRHIDDGVVRVKVPGTVFITDAEAELIEDIVRGKSMAFPLFARPCPMTPRHGFVDSRLVQNAAEAAQVWQEARAADPQAEMMLMTPVEAVASGILTPTMASIGPGNDGATAGKEGTKNFRLLYVRMPTPGHLIPSGQIPYCELVYTQDQSFAVQWRSGPPIDGAVIPGGNYVPKTQTIRNIIDAHMLSPLELEEACKVASRGTVVWQRGGNPISHAAVHGRLNNLAVIFDDARPIIGAVIHANTAESVPMNEEAFKDELINGSPNGNLPHRLAPSILWAMHQGPALCESEHGARFVARAAMQLWRYGATACIGEARHSRTTRNGKRRRRTPNREAIYCKALSANALSPYLRGTLKAAQRRFEDEDEFNSGYGGEAWAQCAEAAFNLYRAISFTVHGLPGGGIAKVVAAAHVVINIAHNNGAFLSKFASGAIFDALTEGDWKLTADSLRHLYLMKPYEFKHENDWPLLRNRKPKAKKSKKLPDNSITQWSLRSDGTILHVQHGRVGCYNSANIPLSIFSKCVQDTIKNYTATHEAAWPSFHGSNRKYWRMPLPSEVMDVILPNLTQEKMSHE